MSDEEIRARLTECEMPEARIPARQRAAYGRLAWELALFLQGNGVLGWKLLVPSMRFSLGAAFALKERCQRRRPFVKSAQRVLLIDEELDLDGVARLYRCRFGGRDGLRFTVDLSYD